MNPLRFFSPSGFGSDNSPTDQVGKQVFGKSGKGKLVVKVQSVKREMGGKKLVQYDGSPRTAVAVTYFYSRKQEVAVCRNLVDLI
jgi:hypothetical protein